MTEENETKDKLSDLLSNLAEDLINLMIREHQYIHQELDHVRHLVGDAARALTNGFDEMNILAIEHNTMVTLALQLNNANNKELLEKCKRTEKQHRDTQLKIVTALQFDDIVQQLTSHAQSRAISIQDMFKRLNVALQKLKHLDHRDDPGFISSIRDLKRDVEKFRIELEKENPVKQTSMTIGRTELF
jgi:LmbE family N-acetylglucosaminyl deacetylase